MVGNCSLTRAHYIAYTGYIKICDWTYPDSTRTSIFHLIRNLFIFLIIF